jgi:hypothetical protein
MKIGLPWTLYVLRMKLYARATEKELFSNVFNREYIAGRKLCFD